MIHAPNELREVAVGATVNLFVSVGQTSRRLKGTVRTTRDRGADGEVLEVHVAEGAPGASEIVFWLGFTDDDTYLLPLDDEDEALVYVKYKHNGGQTGLYIDAVREVGVRPPADDATTTASDDATHTDGSTRAEETGTEAETDGGPGAGTTDGARSAERARTDGATPSDEGHFFQ